MARRAAVPFVGDGSTPPDGPSPYRYTGLLPLPSSAHVAFFSLYSALADRGFDLDLVGRWTMFKASCALGVGRSHDTTTAADDAGAASIARLKARVEAAERGEATSESDRAAAQVMRAQGRPLGPRPEGGLSPDEVSALGIAPMATEVGT